MHATIWRKPATLALSLAVPFALACGGGESGGEMGGQEGQAAEDAAPATAAESGAMASASLAPMGDAQVSGTVEFTRQGDSLTVHVMGQNLSAGAHASHIHNGSCDEPGGVVAPLNDVSASDDGSGMAETTVGAAQLQAGSPYLVMVHGAEGAPVGCAGVPSDVTGGAM